MSVMLPPPEKDCLDLGFVRLTDSAPLVVARELGLFEKYRLDVTLSREVSWANVRDKLAVGALDGAPMPAPLPAMTTLGASGIRVPMLSGLTLSLNGNTITLAAPLWHEVRMRCAGQLDAPSTARALGAVLRARGGNQPTLAVVHAFSTHMILLRALGLGGGQAGYRRHRRPGLRGLGRRAGKGAVRDPILARSASGFPPASAARPDGSLRLAVAVGQPGQGRRPIGRCRVAGPAAGVAAAIADR
jgi:hypothetical protein